LEGLSRRVQEMVDDVGRIKDSQNEMLAGLALYERSRRLKEDLKLAQEPSGQERNTWDNLEAYCRNCTKMVHIVEPTSSLINGRMTITARCKTCKTLVVRTLF